MKCFVCIFLLLHFATFGALSTNLPSNCGKTRFNDNIREEEEYRIINGISAKLGQFPWSVRFIIRNKKGMLRMYCGGSLISSTFVVSAAHCGEFAIIVRVGQTYETPDVECDPNGICAPPYQDIKIKRYIFEDHCQKSLRNDLMLIELQSPAVLNGWRYSGTGSGNKDDFVQPICLPPASLKVRELVGKRVFVSGWGQQNGTDSKSGSKNLLYIVAPVINPENCARIFESFHSNTKNQFCLGKIEGKSACRGDSGSGVVSFINTNIEKRAHLIGIVSYGAEHCITHSVYTFVAYYVNSILSHVDKNKTDL